ncbi:unnamed protein product [Brachionus calyciflorus]|uniref:5' exonuclease Apollo n=1 Tax=Brachionus calyciflorus TaxID=104777 RepID=A0A813M5R3_9BILA|nr:unnamed protein product [Brachionus calyciflorus]
MSHNTYPGYVINNTTIAVDYWPKQNQPNITHYFLTHCHTDHTKSLDSSWNISKIYCSKITKMLLMNLHQVQEEFIHDLEMNQNHIMYLDKEESVNVSLIDANHCPGAVMFLFEGYFGVVLATGDFRYDPTMFIETPLQNTEVDICYLDNTYFNPIFTHLPTRDKGLQQIIEIIEQHRSENVLFRIILKILGKEKLLIDLVDYFKIPIVLTAKRYDRLVNVLEIDKKYFITDFDETSLIFVDENSNFYKNKFLSDKKVITIEPTGLVLPNSRRNSDPNYFRVPYSDHSSYSELMSFVKKLKPKRLIPIVRKMLPNEIDTTDLSDLDKYLDKRPIKECSQKYSLLLQSTTSSRKSSRLNSLRLNETKSKSNNRISTPINSRFITVRNKATKPVKKPIEYDTPEKTTPEKHNINKMTPPTIPLSSQHRMLQANIKTNHPSKMVNTCLTPITEENRSEISIVSELEISDMTNKVTKKKKSKRLTRSKSTGSATSTKNRSQRNSINKENISENENSKWIKINDNVEVLFRDDSNDSLELSLVETSSVDSQSIETLSVDTQISESSVKIIKECFPLSKDFTNKLNPIVRLEKINLPIKTNIISEIRSEENLECKYSNSSDESIHIESTLDDNVNENCENTFDDDFNENPIISLDSNNESEHEILEDTISKKRNDCKDFLDMMSEKLKDIDVTPLELGQMISNHILESFTFD